MAPAIKGPATKMLVTLPEDVAVGLYRTCENWKGPTEQKPSRNTVVTSALRAYLAKSENQSEWKLADKVSSLLRQYCDRYAADPERVVARAIESYVVSDDDAALWPERVTPALARELPSELADRLGMFCDQTGRAVRRVLRDGLSAMLSEHGWGLERVSVTIPADLADELDRLSETKGEDVRDIVVAAVASYLGVDISEVTNSNERDVNQLELFQVSR